MMKDQTRRGDKIVYPHHQIAIIGAGPYGLALAAKLQAAGAEYVLFGRTMSFWQNNVPKGTILLHNSKSWAELNGEFDMAAYERTLAHGKLPKALPAEDLIAYGKWFQRATGIDPDGRLVVSLTETRSSRTDSQLGLRVRVIGRFTSARRQNSSEPADNYPYMGPEAIFQRNSRRKCRLV